MCKRVIRACCYKEHLCDICRGMFGIRQYLSRKTLRRKRKEWKMRFGFYSKVIQVHVYEKSGILVCNFFGLDLQVFNLLVLIVNLNLYCSSEALEVWAYRLYCVFLTPLNYGHRGIRARWSCINIHSKFRYESSVFTQRLPRGQSKFSN